MDIINKYIYPHELSVGANVYCVQEKHYGIVIEEDGIKKLYIKELEKTIDLSNRRDGFYGMIFESSGLSESCLNR